MKISRARNRVTLKEVSIEDFKDGVFYNDEISDVSHGCFNSICVDIRDTLKEINLPNLTKINNDCFSGIVVDKIIFPELVAIGNYCFSNMSCGIIDMPKLERVLDTSFRECTFNTLNIPNICKVGDGCFKEVIITEPFKLSELSFMTNKTFIGCVFGDLEFEKLKMIERDSFYSTYSGKLIAPVLRTDISDCVIN